MAITATFESDFHQFIDEAEKANKALGNIVETSKQVGLTFDNLKSLAETMAGAFGVAFTVDAAVGFVGRVLDSATALNTLSQQTQINVEDLQLLSSAMSEFGVSSDELGRALYRLSRGIAGGDESVTRGLAMMGMSLKDVEGLQGKELFLKIEEGLATLQGGLRDTASADLFGGKLGAAMAGASEGVGEAVKKARELNSVMSEESVKALAEYQDAIKRAETSLIAMAANALGPLAMGFNTLNKAVDQGVTKWQIFKAMTMDTLGLLTGAGLTGTEYLTDLLDEANRKTEANAKATRDAAAAHGETTKAIDTRSQAEKALQALEAGAAVELTDTQRAQLQRLKDINLLNAANAQQIVGVSGPAYAKYTADMQAAAKAQAELDAENKKFQAAMADNNSVGRDYTDTLKKMGIVVVNSIEDAKRAGVEEGALATIYHKTSDEIKAVTANMKAKDEQAANAAAVAATYAKAEAEYSKAVRAASHDTMQAQIDDLYTTTEVTIAEMLKRKDYSVEAAYKIWQAAFQTEENIRQKNLEADVNSRAHYQLLADQAQIAYNRALKASDQYTAGTLENMRQAAESAKKNFDNFGQSAHMAMTEADKASQIAANTFKIDWTGAAEDIAKSLEAMASVAQREFVVIGNAIDDLTAKTNAYTSLTIPGGKPGSAKEQADLARVMADVNASSIGQMVRLGTTNIALLNQYDDMINAAMAALGYVASAVAIGAPGASSSSSAPKIAGARAAGGPVEGGSQYLVGEKGPELFVPSESGTIIPNGVRITINGSVLSDDQKIADAVGKALVNALRSQGVRLNG